METFKADIGLFTPAQVYKIKLIFKLNLKERKKEHKKSPS
jgi:hypothetical protein